jgi:hypothetical protein
MSPDARRAVAYISTRLINQHAGSTVFDYSLGKHATFSGSVESTINIYDHLARHRITGTKTLLYNHWSNRYMSLIIAVASFSGYDYESGTHFNGRVQRSNVSVYDQQHLKYFQYLIA